MPLIRSLPENATLKDLRAAEPDLFTLLQPYGEQLMRGASPLSVGERELIAAYVSALNACRYCHGTHARVAMEFGVSEDLVDALVADFDAAPVDADLKPILRYVGKLTLTPSKMVDADAQAVYEAGWEDTALIHAVAVCAYFNNMNRLVEGSGIVGDASAHAAGARLLVDEGYLRSRGA